jgi:hypothetical protein
MSAYRIPQLALAAILFSIATSDASAKTFWVKCIGCSPANMLAAAESMPVGEIVIYDDALPVALGFSNEMQVIGNNCQPNSIQPTTPSKSSTPAAAPTIKSTSDCQNVKVTRSRTLEAFEAENLLDFHAFRIITGGTGKAAVEIAVTEADVGLGPVGQSPAGSGPNAYDYVNNVIFRARVDQFAADAVSPEMDKVGATMHTDRTGLWDRVSSVARDIYSGEIKVTSITVHFPDGSYVVLNFDVDTPKTAEVKEVKDSENRDVMTSETISQFAGTFNFASGGEMSLQNWVENARLLGVRVTKRGSGGAPGGAVSCHSEIKDSGEVEIVCVQF